MDTALVERKTAELNNRDKAHPSLTSNVTQTGNHNVNVEFAEEFIGNVNLITDNGGDEVSRLLDATLVRDYFNLFVVKDETFSGNCFQIPKANALTHESSESFSVFDEEIKKYPSLFITVNGDFRRCKNPNQMFYYGMVTDVTPQGKNYKICFRRLFNRALPQTQLNGIDGKTSVAIGINTDTESWRATDLLDKTGWIIKRLDIRKALLEHGIDYK